MEHVEVSESLIVDTDENGKVAEIAKDFSPFLYGTWYTQEMVANLADVRCDVVQDVLANLVEMARLPKSTMISSRFSMEHGIY